MSHLLRHNTDDEDLCDFGRRGPAPFSVAHGVHDYAPLVPCPNPVRHRLGAPGDTTVVLLCDSHFANVKASGLLTEENVGDDEFERRVIRGEA